MDLNLEDGLPHIETENWSPGAKGRNDKICDGDDGWDGVKLGSLYKLRVNIAWKVSHPGGQVRYNAWASANGKSTRIGTLVGNQASSLSVSISHQKVKTFSILIDISKLWFIPSPDSVAKPDRARRSQVSNITPYTSLELILFSGSPVIQ